jgi:2-dehydro-3-deoxyphosphogluconate aldolase / (4S)-4-hydroxy-2-oxoglutarate aldolase
MINPVYLSVNHLRNLESNMIQDLSTLQAILNYRIIAIVRGAKPDDIIDIAEALCEGGIKLMEVTLNSPGAMDVITQLSKRMKDKMLIGAGTVLDAESVKTAIESGARFIISPNLNTDVIHTTKQLGAVSIPGAFTPTEIVNAYHCGGDIIKVFPAASNVSYIKDVRAPLSHIPLMPTGGITLENIGAFQNVGAVAFGIGTSLVDTKQEVTEQYLRKLTARAKQFVSAISHSC